MQKKKHKNNKTIPLMITGTDEHGSSSKSFKTFHRRPGIVQSISALSQTAVHHPRGTRSSRPPQPITQHPIVDQQQRINSLVPHQHQQHQQQHQQHLRLLRQRNRLLRKQRRCNVAAGIHCVHHDGPWRQLLELIAGLPEPGGHVAD